MISNPDLINIAFEISKGISVTLSYTFIAWFFGILLACVFTLLRHYNVPGFFFISFFVSLLRGTPVMVQVMFFYYCLPMLGFSLSGQMSAALAFVLNSAAYTSEILRGGLKGISHGQMQACQVLGIPSFLMWKDIILPQLLRVSLPGLTAEFTALVKDTSILSVIGENDIMKRANSIGSSTYSYIEPLMIAACYYYIISNVVAFLSKILEKRFSIHVKSN